MSGKASDAKKINATERRIQALELRKRGKSYRDIADELGVSHTQIRKDIQTALQNLNKEERLETIEMRRLIYERLEMAVKAIASKVIGGDVWAIDRWVTLNAEIGKLYGVYEQPDYALVLPPDVVKMLQAMGVSTSEVVEEFADMMRAASEKNLTPTPKVTSDGE